MKIRPEVQAAAEKLIAIRRDLHTHPELSFEEKRTSRLVSDHLHKLGYEVWDGIAQTGVAARLKGAHPGKRILIRADMDALPIQEENRFSFRSQNPGVMHACGHDGHTAIGMLTAELLAHQRERLSGEVIMMFQPAEEIAGGAIQMLDEGLLDRFPADLALALHLWTPLPSGVVGVREGPVFAAGDRFEIHLKGKGTHGALPHSGVDSVLMAARVVEGVQSILHREISVLNPFVLSFGTIHGGTAFNVIPDEVVLQGTVRSYNKTVSDAIPEQLDRILRGVTSAMNGTYNLDYQSVYPCVMNDRDVTRSVREVAQRIVGANHVIEQELCMAGEDMAFVQERIPGCYFFVGVGNPKKESDYAHHNPRFTIDEEIMPIALEIMLSAAEHFLISD